MNAKKMILLCACLTVCTPAMAMHASCKRGGIRASKLKKENGPKLCKKELKRLRNAIKRQKELNAQWRILFPLTTEMGQ